MLDGCDSNRPATDRLRCSDSLMLLGTRLCCDGDVESTHHFGVYGLWTHAGKLVLVRKATPDFWTSQVARLSGGSRHMRLFGESYVRRPESS